MEQSSQIRELYHRFADAANQSFHQGDSSAVMEFITAGDELLVIGTDPQEWLHGADRVVRWIEAQAEPMREAGMSYVPGDVEAYQDGSVGWLADQARFRAADGTELPIRTTAVARHESGRWRFVQMHFSVGVANEEVEGFEGIDVPA